MDQTPSHRFYRLLLKAAPADLRHSHGPDMERAFDAVLREEVLRRGLRAHLSVWPQAVWDLVRSRLGTPLFRKGSRMNWIDVVGQDVRLGIRNLIRSPGFTLTALLTLALGIGANTAIFSVVNAVILRPLPFPEPDRLAVVWESAPSLGFFDVGLSPPDWRMFQERQKTYSHAGVVGFLEQELSTGNAPSQRSVIGRTSAGFFQAMAMPPRLGRYLTAEEDRPGFASAVISYDLWQKRFGGRDSVIGESLLLDRKSYQVVGVLPRDFRLAFPGHPFAHKPADAWIPRAFTEEEYANFGSGYSNAVVARLRPGLTYEQALSETDVLLDGIFEDYPPQLKSLFGEGLEASVRPLQLQMVGSIRTPLLILLISVGLVLLIGCTNIANLLLSRASNRSSEFALRAALGAGRGRLATQLILECLPLSIIGGLLGLGLAYVTFPLLIDAAPLPYFRSASISMDGAVLGFTAGLSLLTVLIFGLAPGLSAAGRGEASLGRHRSTAGAGARRVQRFFAVGQMALALLLLIGAGLLMRSFQNLLEVQPGFQPDERYAVNVSLPLSGYAEAHRIRAFFQEFLQEASAVAGVESVGASTDLPLRPTEHRAFLKEGEQTQEGVTPRAVAHSWILGDYLQTMGIPLVRGRWFSPEDHRDAPPVILISQGMAERYWPDEDPVGQRIFVGRAGGLQTIVGIVGNVSDRSLSQAPIGHTYSLFAQEQDGTLTTPAWNGLRQMNIAMRSTAPSQGWAEGLRAKLRALDPQLPISDILPLNDVVDNSMTSQRFSAGLLGAFAIVALFLSATGIASVMSHSVHSRRREMGIRLALGARPRELRAIVIKNGLLLASIGAVIGLLGALALSRVLAGLLFGVTATDPMTFVGVPILLLAVALAAVWMPARRASQTDPVVTLRNE